MQHKCHGKYTPAHCPGSLVLAGYNSRQLDTQGTMYVSAASDEAQCSYFDENHGGGSALTLAFPVENKKKKPKCVICIFCFVPLFDVVL